MWCKIDQAISSESNELALQRIAAVTSRPDASKQVFANKSFFSNELPKNNNLDLLRLLHEEIWGKIAHLINFKNPVIDHASLLIKPPGSPETKLHQDRPYWVKREETPSIFSVWIALGDMTEENGGLLVSADNEVSLEGIVNFNSGKALPHIQINDPIGGFPLIIEKDVACEFAPDMKFIPLKKGQAIAFDSFEPHKSGSNFSKHSRLAMKIAYADGANSKQWLIANNVLEGMV
tara:strand:+ start:962 stop:1663 length:702 start_codon:yes stop_codon:yes gene_type:complete